MNKPFYKQTKYWILFVFTTLIVLRFVFPNYEKETEEESKKESVIQNVRVDTFNEEIFQNELKLFANTSPVKQTILFSKYNGDISNIYKKQGDFVEKGEAILKIRDNGLESNLQSAKLALEEAKINFNSAQKLKKSKLISQAEYIKMETLYKKALANEKNALVSYEDSIITANFSGRLEDFNLEVGDYIESGQSIASLNDLSQLKSYLQIPEIYIPYINKNSKVRIEFPDKSVEAFVNYISKVGDKETHTFEVEILTNKESNLVSGLSAPIYISLGEIMAYNISMGFLNLDSEGNPSVKTIDENNIVRTHKLKIISNSETGVWVSGLEQTLPPSMNIITIGHLLTTEGEKVNPTFQSSLESNK